MQGESPGESPVLEDKGGGLILLMHIYASHHIFKKNYNPRSVQLY